MAKFRQLCGRVFRVVVIWGMVTMMASASTMLNVQVAQAIPKPEVDSSRLPGDETGPAEATEKARVCASNFRIPSVPVVDEPAAQRLLMLDKVHQYATGVGQRVAVIDTGVSSNPRFRKLTAGGDFVSDGDGLSDCDGQGTLVAGIIAGTSASTDRFVGVAPAASIIAIRQTSMSFERKNRNIPLPAGVVVTEPNGYGDSRTLATAIVRAVKLGATVVTISSPGCAATANIKDQALGAAVKYAYNRNVVVVAAAGNVSNDSACKAQNPAESYSGQADDWDNVTTISTPNWFEKYVLTVAAVNSINGETVPFSLNGPWVDVAAPGTDIVSLTGVGSARGLASGELTRDGVGPINGTAYAAAYVAGLVALLKERFPKISVDEVVQRIRRSAHASGADFSNTVGYGVVDMVAALTNPLGDAKPNPRESKVLSSPVAAASEDRSAYRVAWIGVGVCLLLMFIVWAITSPMRRTKKLTDFEY